MSKKEIKKVLIIGLDGATFDLIKPWADKGKLPTFQRLMENGVWGNLKSTIPSWTIPAWNSLTTGKNPGNLGFCTFMIKDDYNFRPYFSFIKNEKNNIWDFISKQGKKVCIANVPNIHSVYEINGCMIAGWLYEDEKMLFFPDTLKEKLNEITGGYEVDVMEVDGDKVDFTEVPGKSYLERINEVLDKHSKAFQYMLKTNLWDFGFVVFTEPDRSQHIYWDNKQILLNQYKNLDAKLKELLDTVDKDTLIIIVSDHGFGSVKNIFNINEWLIREDYLSLKNNNLTDSLARKMTMLIIKIGFSQIARLLLTNFPQKYQKRILQKVAPLSFEDLKIDWPNTKAFAYDVCGEIYINLEGRESKGSVIPEDYENIKNEIIQKLKNLTDPETGERINPKIFKREEIYKGEYVNKLPDIYIQVNEKIQSIKPSVGYKQIFRKGKGGNHRINGIFIAYGPEIKKGYKIKDVKIYDIAPTILHIFDAPIPKDIDGHILKEIFEDRSKLNERNPRYVDKCYYSVQSEKTRIKEIIKTLKNQGRI